MTAYTKAGSFGWAGGGKAGALVDLWATSRFAGFPVQNQAPPSGNPDAGPVTTGEDFGNPGGYLIAGITTFQDYYVRVQYGGNTYWGEAPAGTLGGGAVDEASWPTVAGTGPGNLVAETSGGDTVGYSLTDQGSGGFNVDNAGTGRLTLSSQTTGAGIVIEDSGDTGAAGGIQINTLGSKGVVIKDVAGTGITLNVVGTGTSQIIFLTLPTSNPHVVGALWNNSGVVTISAG